MTDCALPARRLQFAPCHWGCRLRVACAPPRVACVSLACRPVSRASRPASRARRPASCSLRLVSLASPCVACVWPRVAQRCPMLLFAKDFQKPLLVFQIQAHSGGGKYADSPQGRRARKTLSRLTMNGLRMVSKLVYRPEVLPIAFFHKCLQIGSTFTKLRTTVVGW